MIKDKYAGELSKPFWKLVNSLKGADQQELYSLGVCLQNLEDYVLRMLKNALAEKRRKKK